MGNETFKPETAKPIENNGKVLIVLEENNSHLDSIINMENNENGCGVTDSFRRKY